MNFNKLFVALIACAIFASIFSFARAEEAKEDDKAAHATSEHVLALTDADFDESIGKYDTVFVEFFESWCGHCRRLAPAISAAADTLAKEGLNDFKIAQLLAGQNPKTAGRFGVQGYPTIKLFRQGEFAEDYEGGRTAEDIVAYIKKKGAQPVNKEITSAAEFKEVTKLAKMSGARVVGVFASKDSVDYKYFKSVALQFAGTGLEIYHSATAAVLESVGFYGAGSAIHVYRPFAKPTKVTYKGTIFKKDLYDFISANVLPRDAVPEYTEDNAKLFAKTGDSIVRIVSEGNVPAVTTVLNAAVKSAELTTGSAIGNIRFATSKWADFEKEAVKECGEEAKKQKVCVLATYGASVKGKAGATYGLDAHPFSAAHFDKFLDRFIKKELKSKVKSEAAPAEGHNNAGVVNTLTGNTFMDIIEDDSKSALVKFHAPWCGHCRSLAPIYDKLAEELKDKFDQVGIYKFDLTNNDLPAEVRSQFAVSGFPTLYFAKKGAKTSPKKHEGKRELEDLKKFVEENL